jgi:predicted nucleic acid-binding protein
VTLVVDASMAVAALIDTGTDGIWAEALLRSESLAAPGLMPAEVANILRRAQLVGDISSDVASIAHQDLLDLRVEFFPYEPFAARVWVLRENITCYDAWYVALAETLSAPLATLDGRLAKAPGTRCQFATPPVGQA